MQILNCLLLIFQILQDNPHIFYLNFKFISKIFKILQISPQSISNFVN